MTCSFGDTQFNVNRNKVDLEQKFAQAFRNSMSDSAAEYNNQGTVSYFTKTENGGYIENTRDDKDSGNVSARFGVTGYIDTIEYRCSDCGDSEIYGYLNEDIDGDGEIEPLLSDYTFVEKDGNKTSRHYEYDSNGNVTEKATVVRDSENYRLRQTIEYEAGGDVLSEQEEYYQNGRTKSDTTYTTAGYSTNYYDEDGNKVKLANYDLATKTYTVTLLDENEQPYLFSKKSELSDEVEYGMYKKGEIVALDEKQYNFEVENMGNSGVEKFFNRLFG